MNSSVQPGDQVGDALQYQTIQASGPGAMAPPFLDKEVTLVPKIGGFNTTRGKN